MVGSMLHGPGGPSRVALSIRTRCTSHHPIRALAYGTENGRRESRRHGPYPGSTRLIRSPHTGAIANAMLLKFQGGLGEGSWRRAARPVIGVITSTGFFALGTGFGAGRSCSATPCWTNERGTTERTTSALAEAALCKKSILLAEEAMVRPALTSNESC